MDTSISPQDAAEFAKGAPTQNQNTSISSQDAGSFANAGSAKSIQQQYGGTGIPGVSNNTGQGVVNFLKGEFTGTNGPSQSLAGSIYQNTIGSRSATAIPSKAVNSIQGAKAGTDYYDAAGQLFSTASQNLKMAKNAVDPAHKALYMKMAQENQSLAQQAMDSANQTMQQTDLSPSAEAGMVGNTALTLATAGTSSFTKPLIAKIAPMATELAPTASSIISNGISKLPNVVKNIAGYAPQATENAAIGSGFQGNQNLIENKPYTEGMGQAGAISAIVPASAVALSKVPGGMSNVGRLGLNSYLNVNKKDFVYGADPLRAYTQNKLSSISDPQELNTAVDTIRQSIGAKIGQLKNQLVMGGVGKVSTLDLSPALDIIDKGIKTAAERNDTSILARLDDVRNAFIHNIAPETSTNVTTGLQQTALKSTGQRNIKAMPVDEALKAIDSLGTAKWTGNPSDDKAVNAIMQQTYGKTRDAINNYASALDPKIGTQLKSLNQQYHDVSALGGVTTRKESADQASKLQLNWKNAGIGGAGVGLAFATHLITGDYTKAGVALAGVLGAGAMLQNPRVASFLMGLQPTERQGILNSTPVVKEYWNRMTGQDTPSVEAPKTLPLRGVEKIQELMPFLQLGKKSATKAGLGEHFDNLTQDLLALPAPTSGVAGTGHTLAMPAQTQSTADDLFTKQFGKSYQQATPQEMAQFIQSLKALPSPKSITTPNTQGTPNPIHSTGGIQQGEIGGMRQRIAK